MDNQVNAELMFCHTFLKNFFVKYLHKFHGYPVETDGNQICIKFIHLHLYIVSAKSAVPPCL